MPLYRRRREWARDRIEENERWGREFSIRFSPFKLTGANITPPAVKFPLHDGMNRIGRRPKIGVLGGMEDAGKETKWCWGVRSESDLPKSIVDCWESAFAVLDESVDPAAYPER